MFDGIPLLRDVNQKKHMKFVGDMIVISNKTDEIKRYIMEYGSVMSSYYQETHRLFGPVMTETADNRSRVENAYHATSKRRANHAVILVGWDDNIEIKESLFSKKTVRGAYLVKNSWGTQLKGMDGYYWMSYSSFGSDKNYVFTNVSEKKENAHVYLYDIYGTSSLSGVTVDEPENIFLNIFERKTENPERITDIPISIYQVENQEVDYDIFIGQSNEEDRNWINQEENFTLVRTDKAINRNGFYTIKLLDEVTVSQKYFVVKLVLRRNGTKTPSIGNGKEVNDVKHNAMIGNQNHSFADVKKGSWYEKSVLWAMQSGVVSGTEKNRFSPHQKITMEQLATILYNFTYSAKMEGRNKLSGSIIDENDLKYYMDERKVSKWALHSFRWAIRNQVLLTENGEINPKAQVSRGELAMILWRYVKGLGEE